MVSVLLDSLSNINDKDGIPVITTSETHAYARGYITALHATTCVYDVGTVTGTGVVNGGPFTGSGSGGRIASIDSSIMTNIIIAEPTYAPFSIAINLITQENAAVLNYVLANCLISHSSITGVDTATPTSPGILDLGAAAASVSQASGLLGSACRDAVVSALSYTGPDMLNFYTALMDYTMANLKVEFAISTIEGGFAAGGGPLLGGYGTGGLIF